jgi:hypothetical protein
MNNDDLDLDVIFDDLLDDIGGIDKDAPDISDLFTTAD